MVAEGGPVLNPRDVPGLEEQSLGQLQPRYPGTPFYPRCLPGGSAPVHTCFQPRRPPCIPRRLLSEERKGLREASTQEG